jgi:hypothetical protein
MPSLLFRLVGELMGEKGNLPGGAAAVVAAGASQSAFEKVTDTATSSVVGVGEDFLGTVRDKSIGAVAHNTVAAARDRMKRKDIADVGEGGGGVAGDVDAVGAANSDPA